MLDYLDLTKREFSSKPRQSYASIRDNVYVCAVMSSSVGAHGLQPSGLLCPWTSQARVLEWAAISFFKGSSQPSNQTQLPCISCIGRQILYHWCHLGNPLMKVKLLVAQLCLTLCGHIDCSWLGFSVHEILQARMLNWVAIPFSRGSSQPRDRTQVSGIAGRFLTIWATRDMWWNSLKEANMNSFSNYKVSRFFVFSWTN